MGRGGQRGCALAYQLAVRWGLQTIVLVCISAGWMHAVMEGVYLELAAVAGCAARPEESTTKAIMWSRGGGEAKLQPKHWKVGQFCLVL